MQYKTADIWAEKTATGGWVVVTTNTVTRRDGLAVMGAGIAKDAAIRYPDLPQRLADHMRRWGARIYVDNNVICLPTKHNWRNPSDLDLIEEGCHELVELARILDIVGNNRLILLPKLGCGMGGLNWERQVRPVVDSILTSDRFVLVSQS